MKKIAVYDMYNEDRLLGHMIVEGPIEGKTYGVAYPAPMDWDYAPFTVSSRSTTVENETDWASYEVTTFVRTVLLTKEPLCNLMLLDDFLLPDEGPLEAHSRRSLRRVST